MFLVHINKSTLDAPDDTKLFTLFHLMLKRKTRKFRDSEQLSDVTIFMSVKQYTVCVYSILLCQKLI